MTASQQGLEGRVACALKRRGMLPQHMVRVEEPKSVSVVCSTTVAALHRGGGKETTCVPAVPQHDYFEVSRWRTFGYLVHGSRKQLGHDLTGVGDEIYDLMKTIGRHWTLESISSSEIDDPDGWRLQRVRIRRVVAQIGFRRVSRLHLPSHITFRNFLFSARVLIESAHVY